MSTTCAKTRVFALVVLAGILWQPSESAHGHVTLIAPDGGEVLEVGSVFVVTWEIYIQHSTLDWDLWYSTTGSKGPWTLIAEDLPAGDIKAGAIHTYEWTVPDDPSAEVRVRVQQDNENFDYEDISAANLTIGNEAPECIDNDEDGYGDPGNVECPSGPEEDCDDTNPGMHPGADEVCDDTIDNNCDGFTDLEDASCSSNVIVNQVGLTFEPAEITVAPGDTIEWRYATGFHTVTSGSPCTADGRFDRLLNSDNTVATYTVPLDETDCLIPYFCIPHCGVGMTGVITVTGVDATPPSLVCPEDVTLSGDASCRAAIPLLVTAAMALDNCDAGPAVSQDPAAGTMVGLGDHAVTITTTDASGNSSDCTVTVTVTCSVGPFVRGDCDADGAVSGVVTDAVYLLNFNFLGSDEPVCLAACDANADGNVSGEVSDAVYLLIFNFLGGARPPSPYPDCGLGTEADDAIGCETPSVHCQGGEGPQL